MSAEQIDIVIPWVNGNDPKHKAKISAYKTAGSQDEEVGGNSRFDSLGEIYYCIRSIYKFAPFVRKIFIITDEQDPHIETSIGNSASQGREIPIEIIDHKTIFKGYEEFLPVFNSRAIETLIWRIPDLSERFILMNDDFMFIKPVSPKDFFDGDKTYCYADFAPRLFTRIVRILRAMKIVKKQISFKESMLRAADIMGWGLILLYLGHTPRALRKSFYESFYSASDELIKANIQYKFRHKKQFNSQELFYLHELRKGRLIIIPKDKKLAYLHPRKGKNYIDNKLKQFDQKTDAIFCCVNALCLADKADQEKVLSWINDRLA